MKFFIIRNHTVENLFNPENEFSMYNAFNTEEINKGDYDSVLCLLFPPLSGNNDEKIAAMQANLFTLSLVIQNINKQVILFTIAEMVPNFHLLTDNHLSSLIDKYNELCYEACTKENITCFNIREFFSNYSMNQLVDWKHYYLSQIALNPKLSKDFKSWFTGKYNAYIGKRKKCLVLDLDNTLWGGVIGEDGIEGIQLSGSYPGNVYEDAQRKILSAYNSGVILAVCSKNNEEDALKVIRDHSSMVLKEKHFAIKKINWSNKAENIKSISETLNIGLDSLVFIDDSPSERAVVKNFLPEVTVPDFPDKPYLISAFIEDVLNEYFIINRTTEEDKKKTQQYIQNAERDSFKIKFADYNDYLKELNMSIEITLASKTDVPRIAQLTQKTNQFNLTTRRYSESDINEFIQNGSLVFSARVKDKFGDYGLTGVCIAKVENNNNVNIDTLLMSCRVIGRDVEFVFIDQVINFIFTKDYKNISAAYEKSAKNVLVEQFYEKSGFAVSDSGAEFKKYVLESKSYRPKTNNIIKVEWKHE